MTDGANWPASWAGQWQAEDGKTVRIERDGETTVVSVSPGPSKPPYRSAVLLGGGTNLIARVQAACAVDDEGRLYLEIEAGTAELGPTYRLYAATEAGGGLHAASVGAARSAIVLIPNTRLGLYDDFEDDLGVPWAYPLLPMRSQ